MTKVIDMKHLQMITMMCVICVTASCTTQKIAYRERFEDAKGYALYACIAHMNKFVDSTSFINKDYSGEYFVQLSSLYNPQIQISAESETKRSIFREKDKTKRSKKESAQHSKSRNKSFVMTSVSAL